MFLSDLQSKNIISLKDGRLLGRIIDAKIDEKGQIMYLIVEPKKGLKVFSSSSELTISFSNIQKIGADVILVNV